MPQGRPTLSSLLAGLAAVGLFAAGMTGVGAAQDEKPTVVIATSMGDITVELDPQKAPITVENFLKYADSGFYDGTIFHRVIGKSPDKPDGFMIQGGGMTPDMREKDTNPPVRLEVGKGLSNTRGTIAMARTNNPNSATSQFFINIGNNTFLDDLGGGYAVFGKVVAGMDVVDKIAAVPTTNKAGHSDVPSEPIVIKSVKRKGN